LNVVLDTLATILSHRMGQKN